MANDIVDEELAAAERNASPERFPRRPSDEIERVLTASSAASTSTASSIDHDHVSNAFRRHLSRVSTQQDLERHPTALSRIATQRTQHGTTVGGGLKSSTSSRQSKRPLPNFGAGKPYPPALPSQEDYVVEFDGPDDPMHSQNWPFKKKVVTAVMLAFTTLTASFTSSIFSNATQPMSAEFHVGFEVGLLGTSFYVLGFAFGPTLWAPLSELRGRKLPLVIGMFGFSVFTIAVATSKDIQTALISRFFAGFFGACPLAVVAAVFSDLFDNKTRGIAITIFSICVFCAPFLAPFIGGFIVESYLGWRWTEYLPAIMGFFATFCNIFFLEETYPPVILVEKAADLRRRTKNWGIHAKQEEIEVDLRELVTKNFTRPLRILFTEPIVLLLSIYMSFIYGLLYMALGSYPIVFVGVHGMSAGVAGLCFFGMIIGQVIAGIVVLIQQPWYIRKLEANNGIPVPEWRLPSVMAGGISFTIGLFWFGWYVLNIFPISILEVLLTIFSGLATQRISTGLSLLRLVSSPVSASCPSSFRV